MRCCALCFVQCNDVRIGGRGAMNCCYSPVPAARSTSARGRQEALAPSSHLCQGGGRVKGNEGLGFPGCAVVFPAFHFSLMQSPAPREASQGLESPHLPSTRNFTPPMLISSQALTSQQQQHIATSWPGKEKHRKSGKRARLRRRCVCYAFIVIADNRRARLPRPLMPRRMSR